MMESRHEMGAKFSSALGKSPPAMGIDWDSWQDWRLRWATCQDPKAIGPAMAGGVADNDCTAQFLPTSSV